MAAMFDFHSLKDFVAYPIRFVFGHGDRDYEDRSRRTQLIQRWRRGEDGKLEGRWERDDD